MSTVVWLSQEHAKHRLAAQLEAMHTAANADMQARQQAVEQEVKLLEEQIRSEMETSEDGAHLYRLHRQVKFHKELAIDTHRKRNAAEERCRELDDENTSNLARIAQLQDMVAQLEGAKLDLTAQLRDALADTDAAEADKNVVVRGGWGWVASSCVARDMFMGSLCRDRWCPNGWWWRCAFV